MEEHEERDLVLPAWKKKTVPSPHVDGNGPSSITERMEQMERRIRKILTGPKVSEPETRTKDANPWSSTTGGEEVHSSPETVPSLQTPDVTYGTSFRRNSSATPMSSSERHMNTGGPAEQAFQHEDGRDGVDKGLDTPASTITGETHVASGEVTPRGNAPETHASAEKWDIAKVLGEVCIEERFLKEAEDRMNGVFTSNARSMNTSDLNQTYRPESSSIECNMELAHDLLQKLDKAKGEIQRLELRLVESEERHVQSTMRCANLEEQVASLEGAIHTERKKNAKRNKDIQESLPKLEELFKLQRENNILKVRERQITEALSEQSSLVATLKSRLQAANASPNKSKQLEGKLRRCMQEAQEAQAAAQKAQQEVAVLSLRNSELESMLQSKGHFDLSLASTACSDELLEDLYK
uniref:Uncharacterized protein n=1 Tax=Picocystis salinarum TaxID=88271 RepID=A0A7S3UC08_9CHLO|mmetsp:Transcript_7812/g.48438  ORF Transcript_7812/g.48438 Transcript_7812/m.48438 type:complete len:411 (+) Transcript_7812:80-1312(+)|eukprot:CAMPEP_0183831988 /NCGR_PEP_ID=MMETSP0807_2-20130328/5101_1 /TAXON_ID=88271 /ORGANISM="Picocystis salinarum, Strain CCMP1897" /LENGTH=410 /DNA_ID=CAMNT_0026077607 /DNA_START=57 /DNA_END=1289 /DNA_ORIENTATION=+